jgi:hypothetical protein
METLKGTAQLLDLLAKAGGPAALIYKAGTDFYNYYKARSSCSTAEPNIPKQNELRKMAGDLQESMQQCREKISDVDKKMDQMSLDTQELKGTVSQDLWFRFFSCIIFPQAPENNSGLISNFFWNLPRYIRKSRCTTRVNNTSGKFASDTSSKFATSVNYTCGKFATSINNTGGKFATGDTGGK